MNSENPEFDGLMPEAMNLDYEEEWLSAYLDDELTPAQRSIVEDRVAADPEAARDLEGLQQVRSLVQQLPKWNGPDVKLLVEPLLDVDTDMATEEMSHAVALDPDHSGLALDGIPAADEVSELVMPSRYRDANSRFRQPSRRWLLPLSTVAGILLLLGVGYLVQPMFGRRLSMSTNASRAAPSGPAGSLESWASKGDQVPNADAESAGDAVMLGRTTTESGSNGRRAKLQEVPEAKKSGGSDVAFADTQIELSGRGAEAELLAGNSALQDVDGLPQDQAAQAGAASRSLPELASGATRPAALALAEPSPVAADIGSSDNKGAESSVAEIANELDAYMPSNAATPAIIELDQARLRNQGQEPTSGQVALAFGAAAAAADQSLVVFAARSSSWTEEELTQELKVNDALLSFWGSSVSGLGFEDSQNPPPTGRSSADETSPKATYDAPSIRADVGESSEVAGKNPAPIVVASLPEELEAAGLFAKVVAEQQLSRVEHRSGSSNLRRLDSEVLARNSAVADSSSQPASQPTEALGAAQLDPGMPNTRDALRMGGGAGGLGGGAGDPVNFTPDNKQAEGLPSGAPGRQSIVLFLSRREAESILESLEQTIAPEEFSVSNAADQSKSLAPQRYSWILPSQQLGDAGSDKNSDDGSERVILLMNARN